MSKHLGNILEPIPLMDEHGADAVRWFMAAGGSPWAARRVGHATHPGDRPQDAADLLEHRRLPVALRRARRLAPRRPGARPSPTARCSTAGRSPRRTGSRRRGHRGAGGVRHPARRRAARRRTSTTCPTGTSAARRRRFWDGDPAALATLHECLYVVTLLLAPLTPFVTERVWQDLFAATSDGAARVGAPRALAAGRRRAWSTTALAAQMPLVRRLVELGRAARAEAKVKTRQPLPRALVGAAGVRPALGRSCAREVADELNVGTRRAARPRPGPTWSTTPPRATSARWQAVRQGDAAGRGRRSPRPTPPRSPRPWRPTARATVERRRRAGRGAARRGDRLRDARARAGRWSTSRARPWRSTCELTPELRRAGLAREVVRHGPGGPQDQRLRRHRPDRAQLAVLDRTADELARRSPSTATWSPARCSPPTIAEADDRRRRWSSPTPTLGLAFTVYRI